MARKSVDRLYGLEISLHVTVVKDGIFKTVFCFHEQKCHVGISIWRMTWRQQLDDCRQSTWSKEARRDQSAAVIFRPWEVVVERRVNQTRSYRWNQSINLRRQRLFAHARAPTSPHRSIFVVRCSSNRLTAALRFSAAAAPRLLWKVKLTRTHTTTHTTRDRRAATVMPNRAGLLVENVD